MLACSFQRDFRGHLPWSWKQCRNFLKGILSESSSICSNISLDGKFILYKEISSSFLKQIFNTKGKKVFTYQSFTHFFFLNRDFENTKKLWGEELWILICRQKRLSEDRDHFIFVCWHTIGFTFFHLLRSLIYW